MYEVLGNLLKVLQTVAQQAYHLLVDVDVELPLILQLEAHTRL